jgi:RHS repeat-associated protein
MGYSLNPDFSRLLPRYLYYGFRYYSPDLGRWINCDPIGDHAFKAWYTKIEPDDKHHDIDNLIRESSYGFIINQPTKYIDPLGLQFFEGHSGGASIAKLQRKSVESPTEGVIGCLQRIVAEEGARPSDPDDPSSREAHCRASCRISKECPGGSFTAWIAGDWVQDPWWEKQEKTGSDPGDRAANRTGRECANNGEDCECCCEGVR